MDVHPPKNGIFIGIDPYPYHTKLIYDLFWLHIYIVLYRIDMIYPNICIVFHCFPKHIKTRSTFKSHHATHHVDVPVPVDLVLSGALGM